MAHLDLKADNFVFTEDLTLALIDFGMSESLSKNMVKGKKMTSMYRAPEVFESVHFAPGPVDIFGIGVCLFKIMVQNVPFMHSDVTQYKNYTRYMREQRENLKYFKAFGIELSCLEDKAPYRLILRCLNPNPRLRPTIDELLAHEFISGPREDAT